MSLTDGLVGAWVPSLGPTAGTLLDRSAYSNHGTLTNMDPATDWQNSGGWCLDFDGINDYVATTLQTPKTANRAFLCRVRYSGTLASNQFDIAVSGGTAAIGKGVYCGFGTNSQWGSTGFGCSQYGDGFAVAGVNDSKWHTGVFQHVGNNWSIWVDGVQRAAKTMTTVPSAGGVVLGTSITNDYYAGQIAEVMIFDRALSGAEILQLHQLGPGGWLKRRRRRVYSIASGVIVYGQRIPRHRTIIGGGLR